MASNYTEHYQLPIWAPEDSFLREEFNETNQKIDTALNQSTTEEYLETYKTTDTYSQNIDLSKFPLSRYRKLVFEGLVSYQSSGNSNLYMTLNQVKEIGIYSGSSTETRLFLGNIHTTPTLLRLELFLNAEYPYGHGTTMYATASGSSDAGARFFRVLSGAVNTAALTSLQLESVGSTIPFIPGGELRIWGFRG